MENKDDKNSTNGKVAAATVGVEKLSLSKKKKTKFVKVDPNGVLNIVIDDGRGRDTDFRNNNKPSHAKSQESKKSSSQHQDKGSGRHAGAMGTAAGGGSRRNMARGSSSHSGSSNFKADFEIFKGLGLDRARTKNSPVYPLQTFDMDYDDMTSREIFEDVYADIKTHQTTYRDQQLVSCFYNSIMDNKELFKDKIVLEIGCGMGLFSLFCAKAGAKHVIAVDCSVITQLTQEIVETNQLSDVITVIQSRMEDIKKLPRKIKQVDVIVCNWMGHSLYLDSLVNAVLFARDRFLKPGGLILPDKADLYCTLANDPVPTSKCAFWFDVYGFNMEPIQRDWPNIARFHAVSKDQIMSDSALVHSIDLNTCKASDTNFHLEFTQESLKGGFINSFVLYFKTHFLDSKYVLNTSPESVTTHWAQTVLFIDKTIVVHSQAQLLCNMELKRLRDRQNSVQCNVTMDYLGYPAMFFEKKYILSFY